jgi:hypothetical protein
LQALDSDLKDYFKIEVPKWHCSRKRSSDPIASVEREVIELQGRRATLSSRLTAAEAELTQALDARRELLVAGDLADEVALATVEQKLSAAER